jgi:hypothetical protein
VNDRNDMPRPDETIDDDAVPPPRDAAELAFRIEQRFVHGLLRALHSADPVTRETRIESVLARLGPARGARSFTRRMWLAAATAALFAGAGWLVWPGEADLPRAQAMVEKAIDVLRSDVDRQYEVVMSGTWAGRQSPGATRDRGFRFESRVLFTTRPGRRFLAEGNHLFGRFRAGSDGEEIWFVPSVGQRFAIPWEAARQEGSPVAMFLDVGYLDLHELVAKLPDECELKTVRREPPAVPGGPALVRVEATRLPARIESKVQDAWLLVEETTGVIVRIEITSTVAGGSRSLRFESRGVVELGDEAYRKPW